MRGRLASTTEARIRAATDQARHELSAESPTQLSCVHSRMTRGAPRSRVPVVSSGRVHHRTRPMARSDNTMTSSQRVPTRPYRTILLGAGASRASKYQLPTMDGFFGPHLELHPDLCHALKWFEQSPAECNLEKVLVNLDLSRRRVDVWDSGLRSTFAGAHNAAYNDCLAYIARRLSVRRDEPDPLHVRLFQGLHPGENILTVNYDLVADHALTKAETDSDGRLPPQSRMGKMMGLIGPQYYAGGLQPPGLLRDEYMGGMYIKLHGSLDWMRCNTRGCLGSVLFYPTGQSPLAEHLIESSPCRYCGGFLEPAIIPPSTGKLVDDVGKMSFPWNLAWASLKWADDWVVIGLSMAATDFELAWLLRFAAETSSSPRRIHVVNPDPEAQHRLLRSLPPRDRECHTYATIEEYLSHFDE